MTGHTVILSGPSQRDYAKKLISEAPTNYRVKLSEPKRTLLQNDKMWSMLTDLSVQKPLGKHGTPDDWKHWVMHACGFECQFMEGLDGRPFPIGFRSSKLTVKQMITLIDWMYAFGAENNIQWTEPEVRKAA